MEENLNQFEVILSNEKVHKIISDFIHWQLGLTVRVLVEKPINIDNPVNEKA